MFNKLLLTVIFYLGVYTSDGFAQHIDSSDQLLASIDSSFQEELLGSLYSLVEQIKAKALNENILWQKEIKFSKAIFESVYSYEKTYQDSTNIIDVSLLNCYPVGKGRYLSQLAWYSHQDNSPKSLQMLLTIVAHKEEEKITFSTPLDYYTETWKEQQVGSINYFYRDTIRLDRAEKFAQKNSQFAERFRKPVQSLDYFMVENYQEILKLLGVDYNAKSIGELRDGYGIIADEVIFSVMNNEDFSHDLFHYYSGTTHDRSVRNWVTEEGLAYSWGNAYYTKRDGEMGEQKELLQVLKQYLAQYKEVDILALFEDNFWADNSGVYEQLAPDFNVARLIASLVCDEVYNQHGMEGINKLLTIGAKPNHLDPFFQSINDLIGINRNNFQDKVSQLIQNSSR